MAKHKNGAYMQLTLEVPEDHTGAIIRMVKGIGRITDISVVETGRAQNDDGRTPTERRALLLDALKSGPLNKGAIVKRANVSPSAFVSQMSRLRAEKLVRKAPGSAKRGAGITWELTEKGKAAMNGAAK